MSFNNASPFASARDVLATSLLLSVVCAVTYAGAKALLIADYFSLGMRGTAFHYFHAAISLPSIALTFCAVLVLVSVAWFAGGRWRTRILAALILGLLLFVGYRLNTAPWYPHVTSVRGLLGNAVVTVLFGVVALVILRPLTGLRSWLGFVVAGLLAIVMFAGMQSLRAKTAVMFADVGEETGLREINNSLGVAWGDYDGDGWQDLYVSNHLPAKVDSYLYRNVHGTFSAAVPMVKGDLHGVAWGDYDNDGSPDLFVAGGNDTPIGPAYPNHLFHNEEGKLRDVAPAAGVDDTDARAWGGAWADFNNDGWLDLFAVSYFSSNSLFLNGGDGTFRNVAQAAGITTTAPGQVNDIGTLCASWADYDEDGDMDVVTTGIHMNIGLYRNNGDGTFTDVAREAGLASPHHLGTEDDPTGPSGCAWGDYDNDGHIDLYVTMRAGKKGSNLLFRNRGDGTFTEVAATAGVATQANSQAGLWADFDNDGRLDLYVVSGATDGDDLGWNTLYMNRGDGTFTEVSADASGAPGFPFVRESTGAVADFDNDGCVDILVNNQRFLDGHPRYLNRNLLLRNACNSNHWLKIRLQGTVSNRDGIGAKVTLEAGGLRQSRERGTESHLFAQNSPILHFGLGAAGKVERIVVRWPSGATQTLTDVAVDRELTIVEPRAGGGAS